MLADETRVVIDKDSDIVTARQRGRDLALQAGLSGTTLTLVATAISEVARNIVVYAKCGEIVLGITQDAGRRGIMVIARDNGPGISDVGQAMRDGYSTGRNLGLGLPGARRLVDDFDVVSEVGKGTIITMKKWGS